jgi:putative CocE/NonD family hydrolase
MPAGAAASGRYQLLQGPWYHLDAGTGIDIYRIQLAWFDRWLKGIDTGIDDTTSPLHFNVLGTSRWVDAAAYPFGEATPRTYFLNAGNTLTPAAPADALAADQIVYTAAGSPCGRQSDQWGAGGLALAAGYTGRPQPCAADDRSLQLGPGALTYTTAPMTADAIVAGPIDATIYATSTRPELFLEATLEDVAADGTSTPLTSGALVGSFRALDDAATWLAGDGRPLLPFHPYTRASAKPVIAGAVTRYDIEVFPTAAQIAAGHSLRLTLTTFDTPHLLPTVPQSQSLAGGVYVVQRNAQAASFLEVPLAPAGAFKTCTICTAP